jgi:hypothetical protein
VLVPGTPFQAWKSFVGGAIDFVTLRSEIDLLVERAASVEYFASS